MKTSPCYKCEKDLPLYMFHYDGSRFNGANRTCKQCACAADRDRYANRTKPRKRYVHPADNSAFDMVINYIQRIGRIEKSKGRRINKDSST